MHILCAYPFTNFNFIQLQLLDSNGDVVVVHGDNKNSQKGPALLHILMQYTTTFNITNMPFTYGQQRDYQIVLKSGCNQTTSFTLLSLFYKNLTMEGVQPLTQAYCIRTNYACTCLLAQFNVTIKLCTQFVVH